MIQLYIIHYNFALIPIIGNLINRELNMLPYINFDHWRNFHSRVNISYFPIIGNNECGLNMNVYIIKEIYDNEELPGLYKHWINWSM